MFQRRDQEGVIAELLGISLAQVPLHVLPAYGLFSPVAYGRTEGVGEAFDGVLGRGEQTDAGVGGLSVAGRALQDVAAALGAQHRQHSAQDVQHAEEVGVENAARLGVRALLDRAEQTVSGVVGDHVDPAERPDGCRDRGTQLLGAAHVGRHRQHLCAVLLGQGGEGVGAAGQRHHVVPLAGRRLGQCQTDPRRGTGDEPATHIPVPGRTAGRGLRVRGLCVCGHDVLLVACEVCKACTACSEPMAPLGHCASPPHPERRGAVSARGPDGRRAADGGGLGA